MNIVNNLDLAFFYYGLAYILMAAVCVPLRRDDPRKLPWEYLGLFGLLLGSVAWMNLIAISFSDNAIQFYLRLVLMSLAFVCLIEFGRKGVASSNKKVWGHWIYIPLLTLAALGLLGDEQTLKITPRYALGFIGGILAAVALFKAARTDQQGKRFLQACAAAMVLVSLTSGLIGTSASFFPASIINQENFVKATGLPIPGIRSGLAIFIAILLALYYASIRKTRISQRNKRRVAPFGAWLVASLVILLSVGWMVTHVVGDQLERSLISHCKENAQYIAIAFVPEDISAILESDSSNSSGAGKEIGKLFASMRLADKRIQGLRILRARDHSASSQDPFVADLHNPQVYGEEFIGWNPSGGKLIADGVRYFSENRKEWVQITVPLNQDANSSAGEAELIVDYNAQTWNREIYRARLGPLGTMLLLSLALISLELLRQRSREASRLIAESESQYRSLVEGSPNCVHLFSRDGCIQSVNRNGLELLGWDEKQLLGKYYWEIWPEKERAHLQEIIGKVVVGKRMEFEADFLRPDGQEKCFSVVLSPIFEEKGGIDHFVGISSDITTRKHAEAEKEKLEQQLRQSQKMESIGRLAGGVAHDFNNVLTAIIGYAELAFMQYNAKDSLRDKLHGIIEAGERAAKLTRQLLAFSRKQMLEMTVINLNETVSGMEKMLRRLIGEDIKVQTFLQSRLSCVRADAAQIEQILMNLSINARDAMPKGGILTIETSNVFLDEEFCKTHPSVTPGWYVMVAVSDTGQGMDSETISHVFEPFFTTKERGKGTGLGLATVYGIVKQHNGSIWIYSEPGLGSTFKIYLPAVDDVPEYPVFSGGEHKPNSNGTETVLVVEDEESVRQLVSDILERHGYKPITAADGVEALEIVKSFEGDLPLVITDVIMPKMNGKEMHERLSLIRPNTKVLYISGYTDDVIVHHGILEAGINFLQKPISVQTLVQKVRDILDS